MFTTILAVLLGVLVYTVTDPVPGFHPVWSVVCAVVQMMAQQLVISLILRKRSNKINQLIQESMAETQQKLQMRQNQFMRKPASQKVMMQTMEKEQNQGIDRVLEILDLYKPLYRWNFMMKKQKNKSAFSPCSQLLYIAYITADMKKYQM